MPQTLLERPDMPSCTMRTRVLHSVIGCLLLALIAPWVAKADETPKPSLSPEERVAIRKVIENQLAAFRADDEKKAFSFAAPGIQSQFKTPENFMRMVRRNYQMLYRPRQIHFKTALAGKKQIAQPLIATGEDGRTVMAVYLMKKLPGGQWRIDGVLLLPTHQKGA